MPRILIVDDEPIHLEAIHQIIDGIGKASEGKLGFPYTDLTAHVLSLPSEIDKVVETIDSGGDFPFDIVLADIFMPIRDGDVSSPDGGWRKFFRAMRQRGKAAPEFLERRLLVAITSQSEDAESMRREIKDENKSANSPWLDFQHKPDHPDIRAKLSHAELMDRSTWSSRIVEVLRRYADKTWRITFLRSTLDELAHLSGAFAEVVAQVGMFANERIIVLEGETGTGKELLAKKIHENSARSEATFLVKNCSVSAVSAESDWFGHEKGAFTGATEMRKGWLELTGRGTLFADEFASNDEQLQQIDMVLRRVLGSGRDYARIGSAATQRFEGTIILGGSKLGLLKARMQEGNSPLSQDLYQRINQNWIRIPPLRERIRDIVPLAEHFLGKSHIQGNRDKLLKADAIRWLKEYSWPGNVRELENLMAKIARQYDDGWEIDQEVLRRFHVCDGQPSSARGSLSKGSKALTEEAVLQALKDAGGYCNPAAEKVKVDAKTLEKFIGDKMRSTNFQEEARRTGFPRRRGRPPKSA